MGNSMTKLRTSLSPILMQGLFIQNNEHPYNLRHLREFKTIVHTAYHGRGNVSFLGSKILEILLDSFKKMRNVEAFKTWKS